MAGLYRHLTVAGLLYAITSLALNIAVDLPARSPFAYYSGSLYDLPLLVSLFYWAYIGFAFKDLGEVEPEQTAFYVDGAWSARVAMLAVISLPVLALCVLLLPTAGEPIRTFRLVITCFALLLLSGLLFLKQHLMAKRLLASLDSSRHAYDNLNSLQTHLIQSEKLASIGRLVAGAAHEINNPLTAILGYSDLLASQENIQDQHREMAEKIRHQARRTKTLVSNLLTFAKQAPAERSTVDLNTIVGKALELRELDLEHRNIKTVTDLHPALPPITADENHLLQVCFHIFHNALDAMQDAHGAGVLTVSTACANGKVVLRCADTGPGVADPDHIFDPFYTTKPVGKGTGLGLSACYGIIRDHGGTITCENLPRGGALFSIFLPILKIESAPIIFSVSTLA